MLVIIQNSNTYIDNSVKFPDRLYIIAEMISGLNIAIVKFN